ncbi:unnamed protein product [Thlaspi arvense]|uniref:Uncharacterized protein n=1 Tax=Thlaspi arvense TaxID=13288 RepID=A0AAU9SGL8_THLAR|nr:unnamed protein product [Thlaspi arvense]
MQMTTCFCFCFVKFQVNYKIYILMPGHNDLGRPKFSDSANTLSHFFIKKSSTILTLSLNLLTRNFPLIYQKTSH